MMSIEISDHFEDFICGVWVKKRTIAMSEIYEIFLNGIQR